MEKSGIFAGFNLLSRDNSIHVKPKSRRWGVGQTQYPLPVRSEGKSEETQGINSKSQGKRVKTGDGCLRPSRTVVIYYIINIAKHIKHTACNAWERVKEHEQPHTQSPSAKAKGTHRKDSRKYQGRTIRAGVVELRLYASTLA